MSSDIMVTELAKVPSLTTLPSIFTARPEAGRRMWDFFSSHIRNPNTRRAHVEAVRQFSIFGGHFKKRKLLYANEAGVLKATNLQPENWFDVPKTTILQHQQEVSSTVLNSERWRRLIIEKPFGHDLDSAKALNEELQKRLREEQIYRIDHFAGKDAAQDLAIFRFSHAFVEHLWNRSMIDYVQITVAESVGVEGRAAFYEESGALRDMSPTIWPRCFPWSRWNQRSR